MKLTKEEKNRVYESIMHKLAPVVSNRLNEMSDELLNKAIVAAVDKGDFERAKKFSDYKKSEERKANMNKPTAEDKINYIFNKTEKSKYYVDGSIGGVQTKTFYGTFRLYTEHFNPILIADFFKAINPDTDLQFSINDKKSLTAGSDPRVEGRRKNLTEFIQHLTNGLSGKAAIETLVKHYKGQF